MQEKRCNKCKITKPLTDFHFSSGKPRGRCKPCRNSDEWAARHVNWAATQKRNHDYKQLDHVRLAKNARARERYATDPDYRRRLLDRNKKKQYLCTLKKVYGITFEDYISMLQLQKGQCRICSCDLTALGRRIDGKTYLRAFVDHDHRSGKIRGLLCSECNICLGKFADDPELLRSAAIYLEGACASS